MALITAVSNKIRQLPEQSELLKAMAIADSPEGADYLMKAVEKIVSNSTLLKRAEHIKSTQKVLDAVKEFAQLVAFKYASRAQIWLGETPEFSSFKNMQMGIAEQAISKLMSKQVLFDYAVSEEGHFMRAYDSVDPSDAEHLDKLFNSWLGEKYQIATDNGYFYATDADGNQIQNQKMSMQQIEEIMADSAAEFKEYLQEKGGIELFGRQREYPGEQRLESLKQAAAQSIEEYEKIEDVKQAEEIDASTSKRRGS